MKPLSREVGIAVFSAVLGVAVTALYSSFSSPQRELSLKYTHLASQGVDYVNGANENAPFLTIHRFSWKNNGTANLKDVVLEFAPNGGDSAYDEKEKQKLFIERPVQSPSLTRTGVETLRKGNSVLVKYPRFPKGSVDTLSIISPGIVDTYEATVLDPDVSLKHEEIVTDFEDPLFKQLFEEGIGWREILIGGLIGALLTGAWAVIQFRRREKVS